MKKFVIVGAAIAIAATLVGIATSDRVVRSQMRTGNPHVVSTGVDFNGTPVIVKLNNGQAKAYISQKFSSMADVDNYVARRKDALSALAQTSPDRDIEVVVSPARQLSLSDLKQNAKGLALREIGLDLYVNGKWNRMVQFDETSRVIDVAQDAAAIEQRIRELESAPAPSKPGPDKTGGGLEGALDFQFGVRFARGFMPARSAAALQRNENILLVDSITDVAEELDRRFGKVRIVDVPQLFVIRETKFGNNYGLGGH